MQCKNDGAVVHEAHVSGGHCVLLQVLTAKGALHSAIQIPAQAMATFDSVRGCGPCSTKRRTMLNKYKQGRETHFFKESIHPSSGSTACAL